MVVKAWLTALALCPILYLPLHAAEDVATRQHTLAGCFLYRGTDGEVRVGVPMVSLGMVGVMENPGYRLTPALGERLGPLVIELRDVPKRPDLWWFELPALRDPGKPMILVRLEAEVRPLVKNGLPAYGPDEIVSAKLVYAEFIAPEWRAAWESLDKGITEIVVLSRLAPGKEKSDRLAEAIEKSSQALNTMVAVKTDEKSQALVGKIEPKARVVRAFQRNVLGTGRYGWAGQLHACVAKLRIAPRRPLPELPQACPTLELLTRSTSAAELIAKIKQSWPEEVLAGELIYSPKLRRQVFAWQVESLTAAQFETLRSEAKEALAYRARADQAPPPSRRQEASTTVREWGVVLRPAAADLLAAKGLLRGTLVAKLPGDGADVGLRAGDIIIDYERVYDLVMDINPVLAVARGTPNKGKLEVLRGDRVITLVLEEH